MRYFYKTTCKICALVLILLSFFLSPCIFAQGDIILKKNFGGIDGDEYSGITSVSDGIVAVGYSGSYSFFNGDLIGILPKGSIDAVIVKYDHNGNVMWKKNFGGSDNDYYSSVTAVPDGFVAVGYSNSGSFNTGDWTGIAGKDNIDAIIVKYDHNGNVVWKTNFGGSGMDYFFSVTTVSDGVVTVGSSNAGSFGTGDWTGIQGKGGEDAIMVKYDPNGNVVWKKNFGGNGNEDFSAVTVVSDGIVAVGYSSFASFGNGDWAGVYAKGSNDAIIVKYDYNGNVIWNKNFGGSGIDLFAAATTVSDGIAAVGISFFASFGTGDWTSVTGKGVVDAIIVKFNHSGDVMWKKNFGGNGLEYFSAVTAVFDGIAVVGGSSAIGTGDWTGITGKGEEDAVFVKYDHNGNVMWKKNFGGNGIDSYAAVATVSDGVVAVGCSDNGSFGNGDWEGVTGKGGRDAIIVKYLDVEATNALISNIHADFSCPGQVTVTYDLNTNQTVDVILYYSHNKYDWLIAQTVTGDLTAQNTGAGKTIIWNNSADNVKYGKFYIKVAE